MGPHAQPRRPDQQRGRGLTQRTHGREERRADGEERRHHRTTKGQDQDLTSGNGEPDSFSTRLTKGVDREHGCLSDPGGGVGSRQVGQTLEGSFSAVSTPIFASKYAFFSIFRDVQDSYTFAPLRHSKFADFCNFWKNSVNFPDFCKCC